MVAAAPGGRAAASAPPGRTRAFGRAPPSIDRSTGPRAPPQVLTLMCMSPIPYGSRLSAPLLRSYSFTGKAYFNSDGCSDAIAARREKGANVRFRRVLARKLFRDSPRTSRA